VDALLPRPPLVHQRAVQPTQGAHLYHVCGRDPRLREPAVGEDQVAAVLELIDREPVTESAAVLLIEIQPEAQAGGIDPSSADPAQPPYSRMLRPGICDPGQARRVGDHGETIADLVKCHPRRGGLPGHVVVAVEDDLRAERRMPRHLDRHVPPHLLDRLLDRVDRRGVGGTGHVVTQNPAGGEEPGDMPRAGAVQQLFVFDPDHPSRWKSCCERPTPLKFSRLCIFRKGNADYEKA